MFLTLTSYPKYILLAYEENEVYVEPNIRKIPIEPEETDLLLCCSQLGSLPPFETSSVQN